MPPFRPLLAPRPAAKPLPPTPQVAAQRRPKQQRNYHKDSEWESLRPTVESLYIDEDKKVEEVVDILASQGFKASRRQYLKRLKQWGFSKNVKQDDMKILLSKANARLSHAERFKDRSFIRDGFLPSPSAATPYGVTYRTPRTPEDLSALPIQQAKPASDAADEIRFSCPVSKITTCEGFWRCQEPNKRKITHQHQLGRFGISSTPHGMSILDAQSLLEKCHGLAGVLHRLITDENQAHFAKMPIPSRAKGVATGPQFWIVHSGSRAAKFNAEMRDRLLLEMQSSETLSLILNLPGALRPAWHGQWTPLSDSVGENIEALGCQMFGSNSSYYPGMDLLELYLLVNPRPSGIQAILLRVTLGADTLDTLDCPLCETRFMTVDCISSESAIKINVPLKKEDVELVFARNKLVLWQYAETSRWSDGLNRLEGWECRAPCVPQPRYAPVLESCTEGNTPVFDTGIWDSMNTADRGASFQPYPLDARFHVCSNCDEKRRDVESVDMCFDPNPSWGSRSWDPEGLDCELYDEQLED
ncbi:hypothetical protein Daus18300_011929 [Diaporthe australafricana]|uniref:Clr5 domain-containing protein n=1 Tax=Diaporthe australafricana TaxID=127596 RepID=A0ABR3W4V0_9PEZI